MNRRQMRLRLEKWPNSRQQTAWDLFSGSLTLRSRKHMWIRMSSILSFCLIFICFSVNAESPKVTGTQDSGDVTAAAFGDFYDMSDGAKPAKKGGGGFDIVSGDTWLTTWAGDGTAYLTHDDGLGFDNLKGFFSHHRLCRLDGNPNVATDGFRGVNLNPGLLGKTMPTIEINPNPDNGYCCSIYEQDGVIYDIRHKWNGTKSIDSSFTKSTDGGKTWINHLGQTNAPLPGKEDAQFPKLPWSWLTFVQCGKGGQAPSVDQAGKYVYLTAGTYLVRIPRNKLADLNKNDFEYYRGKGLDGLLDSSWSKLQSDAQPMSFPNGGCLENVVYNFGLQRYISTCGGCDNGKYRLLILTAKHPWGPWPSVMRYGLWGRIGWIRIMCNKYTTADGLKMWYDYSGEFVGDLWNYGMQYTPLYLSTGAVDAYEAENAALDGPHVAAESRGFTGSGYVTGFAKTGDKVAFALNNIHGTGWHIVRIHYTAQLNANARTLSVYVNGRKSRRVILSAGNEKAPWFDRSDIYYLKDGANTFEVRCDEGDVADGILLDSIIVSREPTHGDGRNVAPEAKATASSGKADDAAKGCVDWQREWKAKGTKGEWLQLGWAQAKKIQKVLLYDLVSTRTQVTSGTLTFSDGSSVPVGKLQNDGHAGTIVTFEPKTVRWVRFTVNAVREGTEQAGLGEMEVYE